MFETGSHYVSILGCFNSWWSSDWLWTLGPLASACPLLGLEVCVTIPSQMSLPTRTALRFLQLNLMSVMTEWHRWVSKSLLQLLLLKGQMKTKSQIDKVSQSSEFLHSTLPLIQERQCRLWGCGFPSFILSATEHNSEFSHLSLRQCVSQQSAVIKFKLFCFN